MGPHIVNNPAVDVTGPKPSVEASDLELGPGKAPGVLIINGRSFAYLRPVRDEDGEELLGWRYTDGLTVWND